MEDFQLAFNWADQDLVSIIIGILIGILIFIIGRWLAKLIARLVERWLVRANTDQAVVRFAGTLVYAGLLVAVLIAALDAAGIHTTSLTALLAAAGLAVGLALKDSLSNFASGVVVLVLKPYTIGDSIETGSSSGTVEEVGLFNTVMRTADNIKVIVPNSLITNDYVKNYSAHDTRRINLVTSISYDENIGRTRTLLLDIINNHPQILAEPAPSVDVLNLGEFGVDLTVRAWAKTDDFWRVKSEIQEQMKERFEQERIVSPMPQREIYLQGTV
jgi:small conductance mechanosensitive channel